MLKIRTVRRTTKPIRALRHKLYRLKNSAFRNTTKHVAIMMVLFLSLIATVTFFNRKLMSTQNVTCVSSSLRSQMSKDAADIINSVPNITSVASSISLIPTPIQSPWPAALEQVTSSVSTADVSAKLTVTPTPISSSAATVITPAPAPVITPKPAPSSEITPAPSTPPKKNNDANVLIVIDPGHGGVDPGACSLYKEGLYEKDINLDISKKLKSLLEASGIPVLMTRDRDTEVYKSEKYNHDENIRERSRIANRNSATLFISIHVNAYDTKITGGDQYNGTEVYHCGKTYGEYTGKQLAAILGDKINKKTDTKYNGVKEKNLGVLRHCNMPAFLIETAYLTNRQDHKRLETNEFRYAMAEGIHDGIIAVLETISASIE